MCVRERERRKREEREEREETEESELGGRDKYRENTFAVLDTETLLKTAFQISLPTAKLDKLSQEARLK